jgi:hypothetical protein
MSAPKPAAWSPLIEAIIQVARASLPEEWERYCSITEMLERPLLGEDAGRARLERPRSGKLLATWDLGDAREAYRLEEQFGRALLDELRAGRWKAQATLEHEGLSSPTVPVSSWHVSGIEVDIATNSILRDGKPWLVGVLLQPVNKGEELPADVSAKLGPLQTYAEQQSRKQGGGPVKRQALIEHSQQVLGLGYRDARELARQLPKHLINPAKRRPK